MQIDVSNYRGTELIGLYAEVLSEMKNQGIIHSKNVIGDLGEFLVVDHYTKTKGLPKLQFAPPSTKNIDAISVLGDRYTIKCTTGNITGAFYGIEKDSSLQDTKPLFEYAVIIQLNESFETMLILELDWKSFFRHKHWHSRIQAHNLIISKALLEDAKIIFQKGSNE